MFPELVTVPVPWLPNKLRKTDICAVATSTTNAGHRQHSPCTYRKKTGYSPPGTSYRREKTKKERKEIFQKRRKIVFKNMFGSEKTGSETTKVKLGRRKINNNLLRDFPKLVSYSVSQLSPC